MCFMYGKNFNKINLPNFTFIITMKSNKKIKNNKFKYSIVLLLLSH